MKILAFNFLIFLSFNANGQSETQYFQGALSRDGSVQLMEVEFDDLPGSIVGTYSIPEVGYYDVPFEEVSQKNDTLKLRFFYGTFFCFFSKDSTQITGISEKWNPKLRLHLKKSNKSNLPYTSEVVNFSNNEVELVGTVYHQADRGEYDPFVILVHGSGDQDRSTPYYRSLAHLLAKNGIGVLFYDKRGCGSSTGNFENASFNELAGDVASAFNYLTTRKDLNISKIGLLGTSQGGWIASIAAASINNCAFLILNAGPATSLFEQDLDRVMYSMTNDGWSKQAVDSAVNYTEIYFDFVKENSRRTLRKLEELSLSIEKKSWSEYVNLPNLEDFEWWRRNAYDPKIDLSSIKCPVLSLLGEYDNLVPPSENQEKMENYLNNAGVEWQIKVYKNCGHDLIEFHGLNGDNWDWPHVYWQWRKQPKTMQNDLIWFISTIK